MIHLIHGIHTSFSDSTVPGLVPYLEKTGERVVHPDYGYILALETKRINPMVVGLLKPYIEDGDILVGHSNGCAIIHELLAAGVQASGIVLINAALERNIVLPPWVKWCDVYFNEGDTITEVAELSEELGLTARCWGEMGHAGYKGDDTWTTSITTNLDAGKTPFIPKASGHSAMILPPNLAKWGDLVQRRITANKLKGAQT
jgi:hypothetical protein